MRNRIDDSRSEAGFWPPKRNNLVRILCAPFCTAVRKRLHQIDSVTFDGLQHLNQIGPDDGLLICPNHSYTGDASVILKLALLKLSKPLHFMAAVHVFSRRRAVGWVVQRLGGFSIDREGADRRAVRTAVKLLSTGQGLIIFPEGEIYHLNERLTPLREGVAFMAISAQRDLAKANRGGRVWIIPAAIRYEFADSSALRQSLERTMTRLEQRVLMKPSPELPLNQRVLRFGEVMLTIQEKQHLGRSYDDEDEPLSARLNRLMNAMLERLEREHCGETNPDETVPVRVKLLRQKLLENFIPLPPGEGRGEGGCEHPVPFEHSLDPIPPHPLAEAEGIRGALDDVHRVLQMYSYPGDYISSNPSLARMAETVEKFEEDLTGGFAPPQGRRQARMVLGAPIDVAELMASGGKARAAVGELTLRLENAMSELIAASAAAHHAAEPQMAQPA